MTGPAEERLEVRYVPLGTLARWGRNHKRHDVGGVMQSIERHGMKDPVKFEPTLNGGAGGIVEGNGREEVLRFIKDKSDRGGYGSCPTGMYIRDGKVVPRGVLVGEDGGWLVPVLFGVDAESQTAAESYAVDHNNLTVTGGDFGLSDVMRMWDDGFDEFLASLAEAGQAPVSIDLDDIEAMMNAEGINAEGAKDPDGVEDGWSVIKIKVPTGDKERVQRWLANGQDTTSEGMGKGVMERCGIS